MNNTVSYFLLLSAKRAIASKVAKQNLPYHFVLLSDEPKPQEKAAEGVLVVVRFQGWIGYNKVDSFSEELLE